VGMLPRRKRADVEVDSEVSVVQCLRHRRSKRLEVVELADRERVV